VPETRDKGYRLRSTWSHFPHGADIGVRGTGHTKEEAFEQAALALIGVMVDPLAVRPERVVEICCEALDDEVLLVDWLNALVYEMGTKKMIFGRFDIQIKSGKLVATAWGEPIDVVRHQPAVEVKGATYTALRVAQEKGTWVAECVVDV
jgi:SHS2 domain-containing protein